MNHPTVTLTYFGEQLDIDEQIAPLLTNIWQLDIPTASSCQGDSNEPAHILFDDVLYAQRFLDILSAALPSDTPPDYQPDDDYPEPDPPLGFSLLFWRISPWEGLTHEHPRRWRYITSMWRTFPDMRVRCGVMIEFPHTDLPAVTDIITAAATEYRGEEEDDGP